MIAFMEKLMKEEKVAINITSMIDVIFILLIFFMVSTQFKKNSLALDLPQSDSKEVMESDPSQKTLSVTTDKLELDGKIVKLEELAQILLKAHEANPEISLSVECEKTLEFQRVVQVLTEIQKTGISKIGIVHDQPN